MAEMVPTPLPDSHLAEQKTGEQEVAEPLSP
jgi:hypothetical protein